MPDTTKIATAAALSVAPKDLIELGRITAAYGVKGWVKVQPHSAHADVLLSISQWWMMRPAPDAGRGISPAGQSAAVPAIYKIQASRPQGSTVVAQLVGIADRDQAEALRGMAVYAPRSAFPEPDPDEYYWVDLIGCELYGEHEGAPMRLGVVEDVVDNGAHAILKVVRQQRATPDAAPEPVLDAKGRPVEILIPFVQAHIQTVDLANRRIDSDWPLDF